MEYFFLFVVLTLGHDFKTVYVPMDGPVEAAQCQVFGIPIVAKYSAEHPNDTFVLAACVHTKGKTA